MRKDLAAWAELDRDNQARIASLQKELAEARAERDELTGNLKRTKESRDYWKAEYLNASRDAAKFAHECEAAEASVTSLSAEVERLRGDLEMIAGKRPCVDNLMGNVDIAIAALANEETGR